MILKWSNSVADVIITWKVNIHRGGYILRGSWVLGGYKATPCFSKYMPTKKTHTHGETDETLKSEFSYPVDSFSLQYVPCVAISYKLSKVMLISWAWMFILNLEVICVAMYTACNYISMYALKRNCLCCDSSYSELHCNNTVSTFKNSGCETLWKRQKNAAFVSYFVTLCSH